MAALISPIINYFLANDMCKDYTDVIGERCMQVQLTLPTLAGFQQSIFFDSQTILDGENCTITGISLISNSELGVSPSGLNNLDTALYSNLAILYIANLNKEVIATLPLYTLVLSNNNGKVQFTKFDKQVWENCYVEFSATAFTSPTIPLLFNVYYTPKNK